MWVWTKKDFVISKFISNAKKINLFMFMATDNKKDVFVM